MRASSRAELVGLRALGFGVQGVFFAASTIGAFLQSSNSEEPCGIAFLEHAAHLELPKRTCFAGTLQAP